MSADEMVTINSRKFDGNIRRSWRGGLVSVSDDLLVLVARFEQDVEHSDLGSLSAGTVSFEHFYLHRWYNIFRFHEPTGELRNYYCNVAMPPTYSGSVIDYVDLDIDVVVWPDMRYEVLDRHDFAKNAALYSYGAEIIDKAEESLKQIIEIVENGRLP